MKRLITATCLSFAAAFPFAAFSFSLDDCSHTYDLHGGNWDYRDLGNGYLVNKRGGSYDGDTNLSYVVEACSSGKHIRISTLQESTREDGIWADEEYDFREVVDDKLVEAIASPQTFSLQDLATVFSEITNEKIDVEVSQEESCGCRAAYPNLKGNKKRFDTGTLPF